MFIFIKPLCIAIAGGVFASAATGQTAPNATGTKTDVSPSVPPPHYPSVFSGYRAYADQPLERWQEANQKVQTIGGWRAYAKEAHTPDTTRTESTETSPQKPASGERP
jgi:hypothetical protein